MENEKNEIANDFFRGEGELVKEAANTVTPPAGEITPPAGTVTPPVGETTPPSGTVTPPAGETTPPAGETTPPATIIPEGQKSWWDNLGYKDEATALSEIKTLKETKPAYAFKNEYAKNLDSFTQITGKTDPKLYEFYTNSVKENPTVDDKIALIVDKMIIDRPSLTSYVSRDEMIEAEKAKLGLDVPDGTDLSAADKMAYGTAKAALEEDYKKISDEIKDINEKVKNNGVPAVDLEAQAAKLEETKTKWSNIKTEALKTVSIQARDFTVNEKGERTYLDKSIGDIIFDEKLKGRFSSYFDSIIENAGFPDPSDDTVRGAITAAQQWILWEEFPQILKDRDAMVRDNVIKEIELAGGNIGALKQKQVTGIPEGGENKGAQFFRG